MLNSIFANGLTFTGLVLSFITALCAGILTAMIFSYKDRLSKTLSYALVFLPVSMAMIVMMINGNLGIAISVAGSFTLVRFRSIAGTAREIVSVFIAMVLGTIIGMGYLGIAFMFLVVTALTMYLLNMMHFGENKNEKLLKVTIPEDYDYTHLLDDVFKKYNVKARIEKIKTVNMGSLIEVSYIVELPEDVLSKNMLNDIRTRNSNLSVIVSNYTNDYTML